MSQIKEKVTRFDARMSIEQKLLFEKAAALGGYRNLTSFILATVQKRANEIISQQEMILSSAKDSDIFFEALTNPPTPNSDLILAAKEYKNQQYK